jgi:hypothetical protein
MKEEWLRESGFHKDNIVFVNPRHFMGHGRFLEVCGCTFAGVISLAPEIYPSLGANAVKEYTETLKYCQSRVRCIPVMNWNIRNRKNFEERIEGLKIK